MGQETALDACNYEVQRSRIPSSVHCLVACCCKAIRLQFTAHPSHHFRRSSSRKRQSYPCGKRRAVFTSAHWPSRSRQQTSAILLHNDRHGWVPIEGANGDGPVLPSAKWASTRVPGSVHSSILQAPHQQFSPVALSEAVQWIQTS